MKYHDCFDGLQCARLKVPLDWFNGMHMACISCVMTIIGSEDTC